MSQLQHPAPPQPEFLLPPRANSAAGDHYFLVTRGCSLPKSTLVGDFTWDIPLPARKGSAQATKGGRRWMSCCMEGRQECGQVYHHCAHLGHSSSSHPASIPSVLSLLAGILPDPGAPRERTTREKDPQLNGSVSGGF